METTTNAAGSLEVLASGRWEHCSPELLKAGIDCATTPRRPCECKHGGSHDHFISGDRLESENRETLAYALPKEQQRVRNMLPMYDAIPTGIFAATMMRQSLARAEQAAASGDVIAMLAAYEDLKGYDA